VRQDFDSQSGFFFLFSFLCFLCRVRLYVSIFSFLFVFRYNRNLGPYPNNDYVSQV